MNARELILLTPYRYPTSSPLTLANEEMAAWLNAYSVLWHPALLWGAARPPRVDVPYDYEQPKEGHIYGVPDAPPMIMPEDWEQRVQSAGALALKAGTSREETFQRLRETLAQFPPALPPEFCRAAVAPERCAELQARLLALSPEQVRPFLALGLGYLLQSSLAEAMEHENLLRTEEFWEDIQRALAALLEIPLAAPQAMPVESEGGPGLFDEPPYDPGTAAPTGFEEFAPSAAPRESEDSSPQAEPAGSIPPIPQAPPAGLEDTVAPPPTVEPWRQHLQAAANKLLSAREVLYPVTIYLLDLCILEENKLDAPWPAGLNGTHPLNVIATATVLEKLHAQQPERFQALRDGCQQDKVQVCGGCYTEREDALLPFESQLWNLRRGQQVAQQLLGKPIEVFARKRFWAMPQLPLLLTTNGLFRALMLTLDESAIPQYQSPVVGWASPDGKQVDAFVRKPHAADSPETFFNLGYFLFKTTREDHTATLAFLHGGQAAHPWYDDFLELATFGPILGDWCLFQRFFNEVMAGEHTSQLQADEFHFDYLSERAGDMDRQAASTTPVSGFGRHQRWRRRIDTCWTLAAFYRALARREDTLGIGESLGSLEDRVEAAGVGSGAVEDEAALAALEAKIQGALADRLLARAAEQQPGYLLLNPCSFARRLALELPGAAAPLPIKDAVKACQLDGNLLRAVVEVPALGFAWIPRSGAPGTPAPPARLKLADTTCVRNEFLEAEVDPQTGGLRGIRDRKGFVNRVAQRLVWNPGSHMQATSIKTTFTGPALGEIVTEGNLLGEQQQVLATFRQRFRAWLGRPVLEIRIELTPQLPAAGYPWHAYYGARFAWRDERAMLLRGWNSMSYLTSHMRPQTPDFLEIRAHRQSTAIFPGGLPFLQRHESRMVDVLLMPQGETATVFDLTVALDREYPALTAFGLTSPAPLVPTAKGPPHIGAAGWLFHLDTPSLLLTGMRPGGQERSEGAALRDLHDAVTARLLECAGQSGHAELRCLREPRHATILDGRGGRLLEVGISGDAVLLEVSPGDFVQAQIEFGG